MALLPDKPNRLTRNFRLKLFKTVISGARVVKGEIGRGYFRKWMSGESCGEVFARVAGLCFRSCIVNGAAVNPQALSGLPPWDVAAEAFRPTIHRKPAATEATGLGGLLQCLSFGEVCGSPSLLLSVRAFFQTAEKEVGPATV